MPILGNVDLGEVQAEVISKDIKHVHLSVYPPDGKVRISAPTNMPLDTIRLYALSKLDWIKRQQRKLRSQEREPAREFLDQESHYVWGRRYLLKVVESDSASKVELKHSTLQLFVRVGSDTAKRLESMEVWYRQQIRTAVPPLLKKWEPILGVRPAQVLVQRMKTLWGSCNPSTGSIRLNTDLARKPPACLEYILVHEMVHLIEPSHNARFQSLMTTFLPNWKQVRTELNRLPVQHEEWGY